MGLVGDVEWSDDDLREQDVNSWDYNIEPSVTYAGCTGEICGWHVAENMDKAVTATGNAPNTTFVLEAPVPPDGRDRSRVSMAQLLAGDKISQNVSNGQTWSKHTCF